MSKWSLVYRNEVVHGESRAEWEAAPDKGVQVLVLWEKPEYVRWTGVEDRQLWTGEDLYALEDWTPKEGTLIPDDEYERVWRFAFYDMEPA